MSEGNPPQSRLEQMVTDFVALPDDEPSAAAVEPKPVTEPEPEPQPEPGHDKIRRLKLRRRATREAAAPVEDEPPEEEFVSVDVHHPEEPVAPVTAAVTRQPEPEPEPTALAPQPDLPELEIREQSAIVAGQNLFKIYGHGPAAVNALNGVSIELVAGSFTAIMGPSGSGKSTLMHLLAGLDTPTRGEVWIGPTRLGELGEADRTRLRRSRVGFVFQSFNLLPMLTVEQNITLPQRIAGRPLDRKWLEWLLVAIGLQDRRQSRPAELSGGEQQRVSLARALFGRPTIVFADEPTGNLDSRSTNVILTMLRRAVADLGQTVVIVTHDPAAAARADRIVFLEDGRIVRET